MDDESKVRVRYAVVGGNPFRGYTGTTTYTGLRLIGVFDDLESVGVCVESNYDECGGLIDVFEIPVGE